MKIPPWPRWLPYPISWLRGLLLTKSFDVRRGEAEWQRAGEIPELSAYLTEK
ncbi:hypothetical protein QUB05_21055 [Microcoleus sp. F10-C6]|uniref:hypothetical protein n=1 Tax=unclassified Microcoleus TaxID=2642155 RepID=UPI002FD32E76